MLPIDRIELNDVLFLDIKNRPMNKNELTDYGISAFEKKIEKKLGLELSNMTDQEKREVYKEHSIYYSEFSKIEVISFGFYDKNDLNFYITSIHGKDEYQLLKRFYYELNSMNGYSYYCSFYMKYIDHPMISKRKLINDIAIPNIFDVAEHKPWEKDHLLDLSGIWNFKNYSFVAIEDLKFSLGIEGYSEKDMVGRSFEDIVFYIKLFNKLRSSHIREYIAGIKKRVIETDKK